MLAASRLQCLTPSARAHRTTTSRKLTVTSEMAEPLKLASFRYVDEATALKNIKVGVVSGERIWCVDSAMPHELP